VFLHYVLCFYTTYCVFTLRIVFLDTIKQQRTVSLVKLEHSSPVLDVAFDKKSQQMVTGSADGSARRYKLSDAKDTNGTSIIYAEKYESMIGHKHPISKVTIIKASLLSERWSLN